MIHNLRAALELWLGSKFLRVALISTRTWQSLLQLSMLHLLPWVGTVSTTAFSVASPALGGN